MKNKNNFLAVSEKALQFACSVEPKTLDKIIEEEKYIHFKIEKLPEPTVYLKNQQRGVIPPKFYKKRK